jgi:hypothetical protein
MYPLLALLILLAGPPAEVCTACHPDRPAGAHHDVACVACHLGDAQARQADVAHQGLEAEPGALSTVSQTCAQGACHPVEGARVQQATMTRATGIVAVTRAVLGETPTPQGDRDMPAILAAPLPTPAEDYTRRLCAGCHLGTRRDNRDDAIDTRGSGCSACHLEEAPGHPTTPAQPGNDRCMGCHSRSGRVTLSYAGLSERTDGTCVDPVVFPDGRTICREPPDTHHAAGLDCVDCHTHNELMGQGEAPLFGRDAVEITCEACHDAEARGATWAEAPDPLGKGYVARRGMAPDPQTPMRVARLGGVLWNLRPTGSTWTLYRKADGAPFTVPATPTDAAHQQAGHERLSCQACHSARMPTCPTCHVSYEPEGEQWDFGRSAVAPGFWRETGHDFTVAPPVLGVRHDGQIGPATPGMILDWDLKNIGATAGAKRLFSTFDPHTTTRAARGCADCHRQPAALGFGKGTLTFGADGGWTFVPQTPDPANPAQAADRWVAVGQQTPGRAPDPRIHALEPLSRSRALTVGACLECHQPTDPLWVNFPASLATHGRGQTPCR